MAGKYFYQFWKHVKELLCLKRIITLGSAIITTEFIIQLWKHWLEGLLEGKVAQCPTNCGIAVSTRLRKLWIFMYLENIHNWRFQSLLQCLGKKNLRFFNIWSGPLKSQPLSIPPCYVIYIIRRVCSFGYCSSIICRPFLDHPSASFSLIWRDLSA